VFESQYIPGPWYNSSDLWGCITTKPDGHGRIVATIEPCDSIAVQRATASLIAKSPEMAEELQNFINVINELEFAGILPASEAEEICRKARLLLNRR
jgi:hypothetical protein